MRWGTALGLAFAVVLSLPAAATAQKNEARLGVVGLSSVDLPRTQIDPVAEQLDAVVARLVPDAVPSAGVLSALRNDPLAAQWCTDASAARAAGAEALQRVNFTLAQRKLGQASGLYMQCHGDWTQPDDVAELFELRAQVAYGKRNQRRVYDELRRALPVHPTKKLDAVVFPPEVIQIFDRAKRDAAALAMAPPPPSRYIDIARRTRVRWVLTGELRRGPQEARLLLTLVERNGDLASTRVRVPIVGDIEPALEEGVRKLLGEAGVLQTRAIAGAPTPTPQPVPTQALPETLNAVEMATANPPPQRPWYGRWPVWAGVGGVLVTGAIVGAVVANNGSGGVNGNGPPPGGGIEIVVDRP